MDYKVDFLVFWLDDEIYDLLYFGEFGVVDVLSEIEGFVAVLDLELAACHIGCVIELDLKVIKK